MPSRTYSFQKSVLRMLCMIIISRCSIFKINRNREIREKWTSAFCLFRLRNIDIYISSSQLDSFLSDWIDKIYFCCESSCKTKGDVRIHTNPVNYDLNLFEYIKNNPKESEIILHTCHRFVFNSLYYRPIKDNLSMLNLINLRDKRI